MATERREFTQEEKEYAWSVAKVIPGENKDKWRKDYAGDWIGYDYYGDTSSQYGWEIDHQKPLVQNGTYDLSNLVPMQWNNNRTKGDDYPNWTTSKTSLLSNNIDEEKYWTIK